ncbi:MAG: cytochrome c oxidase subunit 3 [Actinobacteria bacterium]|nr:cytochrome c oxidase subunit 3 [Actinomycetota bacterium]
MSTATVTLTHGPEELGEVRGRQRLAVLLLIAADAAFVLSLVFTYFYLRALDTEGGWIPQDGRTVGPTAGWVIAGVAVLSAVAYRWGELGIRGGRRGRLLAGSSAALLLVLADAALQTIQLGNLPMPTTDGAYASSFIVLAGYHLVHLVMTAVFGIGICNRARLGRFSAANHSHVEMVGLWWIWVAVSALLTAFTTSFVGT